MSSSAVPQPWRVFLSRLEGLETAGPTYQALRAAYLDRASLQFPPDAIETWSADQGAGVVAIETVDGRSFSARFEFLGSCDGESFLWGDVNSSLRPELSSIAQLARKRLVERGWTELTQDQFAAGYRDAEAICALASQVLDGRNFLMAAAGQRSIGLVLDEVREEGGGLVSQLLDRFRSREQDPIRALREQLDQQISNQVQQHVLTTDQLFELERELAVIRDRLEPEHAAQALAGIDALDKRFNLTSYELEGFGHVAAYRAEAHALLGDGAQAYDSYRTAVRCREPEIVDLARWGMVRTAPDEAARLATLETLYLTDPSGFVASADAAQRDIFVARLQACQDKRSEVEDSAETVLLAAIAAMHQQELDAHDLNKAAEAQREQSHVLGPADALARECYSQAYREMLLTWFTPGRLPSMASISSPPDHDPEAEKIISQSEIAENEVEFDTHNDARAFGGAFRYRLKKCAVPLDETPVWRIQTVWAVDDDETFELFD